MSAFAVEKPRGDHDLSTFGCGKEELNRFLKRFARKRSAEPPGSLSINRAHSLL